MPENINLTPEFDPACLCWRQLARAQQGQVHVAATAWALMALARSGKQMDPKHLSGLLDAQLTEEQIDTVCTAVEESL